MTAASAREAAVDARALPLSERAPRILAVFDALAPGESFEFSSGVPPRRLLAQFQAERKGLFEWSPVEEGPETWRIELYRRRAAPGDLRGVGEALSWDHGRLDTLEALAFGARLAGDFATALVEYSRFASGLKRHAQFEDDVLFPRFEAESGLDPAFGPTAVLRLEHGEILLLLQATAAAIGEPDSPFVSLRRRFHQVLCDHSEKEEIVLYPGLDHLIGAVESDGLVSRFQELSL